MRFTVGLILGLVWNPLTYAANVNDFVNFSLTGSSGVLLPGRLYVPPSAVTNPATMRPLIVFLHGAGESGVNNTAQVNVNIDNLLAEAKRREAFLFAPQTSAGWTSATMTDRVMTMVDRALADYPVDPARLYATGLSMGGGGTWNLMNRHGDRFAAAVPICAVGPGSDYVASRLVDDSIWAFHARNDATVGVGASRNMINSILAAGSLPAPTYPISAAPDFDFVSSTLDLRYREYRLGGHGIWGTVYNTPAMYDWLFAHSTVPEPSSLAALAPAAALLLTVRRRQRAAAP
jgi:predicted peptidase